VKQCITPPASRAFFLAHERKRVGGGGPGMDHQRLSRPQRGANMHPEPLALPPKVAGEPIVVESRLADRHHFGLRSKGDERIDRGLGRVFGVRVHADRRIQIRMRHGERVHRRPIRQIDPDAKRVRDACCGHGVEEHGQIGREVGEIQMAMGIDVHRDLVSRHRLGGSPTAEAARAPVATVVASENYIVCVGRMEPSDSPRICSIVARAVAPVSSWVNWTPMPCVRLPWTPSGGDPDDLALHRQSDWGRPSARAA
jgi:hypothetical protein